MKVPYGADREVHLAKIREVRERMVARKTAEGDEAGAKFMAEFFDRMARIVAHDGNPFADLMKSAGGGGWEH